MGSGSKRQKIKTFIRNPFSGRKKGKAPSRDDHDDSQTSLPATTSSDRAVDAGSASASSPRIVVYEVSSQDAGLQSASRGGIFPNASHFSVNNSVMMDNTTVNIHGESDRRKAMERLLEHSIQGAAYDSSARYPLPRCHPGTRIEINQHIITWFYNEENKELLIWVYGAAGVGKSAIMQSVADKLADSKHLGASTFVSRPNGRNNSQQLVTTIAYELAVHIEDYCTFVTEKLNRDPALVNKGMQEQFKTFIVEPFVERKIGAGGHPWCIILDGLDELDAHDPQREIIHLIADFVVQHPDVPLRWLVASRPEPHIVDTFNEDKIVLAHVKVDVPANSKESRRDVERFLKASLEEIQRKFPRTVPKQWPSDEQFSQLADAASGFFVLADTAIRFIGDPRYANPTLRLNQVLSALNGLPASVSYIQPFAHLDALYTSILSSIPSDVWSTTKRVLGALLYAQGEGEKYVLKRLPAISIILNLDLSTIYASFNGCYSLLNTSDPKDADWKPATFYHASFGDYLLDPARSKQFSISFRDVEDDLLQSSLTVWQDFQVTCPPIPGQSYEDRWIKYISSLISIELPTRVLQINFMRYIHEALFTFLVEKHGLKNKDVFPSDRDKSQCFDLLSQLEDATFCYGFRVIGRLSQFLLWLFDLWEVYHEELTARGIIQQVGLRSVQFTQVQTCSAEAQIIQSELILKDMWYSTGNFGEILASMPQLELRFPQLPVLACGTAGNGCLVFRHLADVSDLQSHGLDPSLLQAEAPVWIYFVVPYPHSTFYHDAQHYLRDSLQAISTTYSQTIPESWPSKEQLLKLGGAVSHHSGFASLAIQFVKAPLQGNSVSCLDQLIALIDGVDHVDDQPFIYIDALYTHILTLISSDIWPTTHQVLGAFLHGLVEERWALQTPMGVSIALGIELSAVYAALSGCSMVQMPQENAPLERVFFSHPLFYDYLVDPARSKNFHISLKDTKSQVWKLLIDTWQRFKKFHDGKPDDSTWDEYCSQYHSGINSANDSATTDFNLDLRCDVHDAPIFSLRQYDPAELKSSQIQDYVFRLLGQLDFVTIQWGSWSFRNDFVTWLFEIWNMYEEELISRDIFHGIQFQDLQFDHLEWDKVYSHVLLCGAGSQKQAFVGNDPKSPEELEEYISGLQLFQQHMPDLQVLICGCPGHKFAVFVYEYTEDDLREKIHQPEGKAQNAGDLGYYVLPYPD